MTGNLFFALYSALAQAVPIFAPNKNGNAMIGTLITMALTVLAIWLLVDSAVEFVRDGQDNNLATEP